MKIILDFSRQRHNKCCQGDSEYDHCLLIAKRLYELIKKDGQLNVKILPDNPSMGDLAGLKWAIAQENKIADSGDYYIGIHTNAAGGTGCEAIYFPGNKKSKTLGIRICKEIAKLGPEYRRAFSSPRLIALNGTKSNAIIVECWFHDSESESRWGHNNINEVAEAIRNGIYSHFDIAIEKSDKSSKEKIIQQLDKVEAILKKIRKLL